MSERELRFKNCIERELRFKGGGVTLSMIDLDNYCTELIVKFMGYG